METLLGKHWHHLDIKEAITLLNADPLRGLDIDEHKRRLAHFGPNIIAPKKGKGPLLLFLLQFHQPLIYILITAGVITGALGEWVDSSVIIGVVIINAIIGFLQESKAVSAIEALSKSVKTEATVVRAGNRERINASEIVPGDLVLLQSGDKVPADLRLISIKELRVDESALTGETLPVEKTAEILLPETVLADRRNMAYASSLITYGQAAGVAIATGDGTELGKISELIASAPDLQTPLTKKIAHFGKLLLYIILGLAGTTFGIGVFRGEPAVEMFMAAVALAVGAIPEGLPAALTITLAIGVSRMARRRAVIRNLPAVETLGSTTTICSDKTGTLTQNQMTVQTITAGGSAYELTGVGYNPDGLILNNGTPAGATGDSALLECLKAGLLCNESDLKISDGVWTMQGDPTEVALITSAVKGGIESESIKKLLPRIDVIPFESQHQYMATLHTADDGSHVIYAKGAIEVILGFCSDMLMNDGTTGELVPSSIIHNAEVMAERGLRVIACATKKADTTGVLSPQALNGMTFLGLQGMIDPPRPEAIDAIRACQEAGISIKMITGDHLTTARSIAERLGIIVGASAPGPWPDAMSGSDIDRLGDSELSECVAHTSVFGRITPEQKLRLVTMLQSRGQVVAMTGDGVNDGPALKTADIGIAMGVSGTEVAREAADMILTDDNFATIVAAVEEGRGVFDNLTKFIVWTLPTNIGEGLVILFAIVTGMVMPILPVQILWINMTTAVLLGLMLAFEPREPGLMVRPPRNPEAQIITGELVFRIILVGSLLMAGAFVLFNVELAQSGNLALARTIAVNVFVMGELMYLFNCRSLTVSMFRLGLFSNLPLFGGIIAMMLLQVGFTYIPGMNTLFHSAPLSLFHWAYIMICSLSIYGIVGIEKSIRGAMRRNAARKAG
jgi:cation-transporting P-type ATPase F